MKKQISAKKKLSLSRESIRMMETGQDLGAVRGASGEDCTVVFRNCHTTTTITG